MYGPEDHFNLTTSHVIPALIMKVDTAIKNNEPSIEVWGTGEVSREFLYVDDCVDAIIRSIQTDTDSQPINIGTGQETKIIDLVKTICNIMGYTGEILFDKTKPDGQPRRCLDVSRAQEILNFKAKTSLQQGLEKTIKWYKENI
jgi:GDP-L-fucose synthase